MTSYSEVQNTLGDAIRRVLPKMNVHHYVPRSLVPPAAIVRPTPNSTINYEQQYSSSQADWMWTLMLVVGQVNEQWAQDEIGKLISPDSELIKAINNVTFSTSGWARVQRGNTSQMNFGKALYSYAELTVRVTA